MDKLFWSIACRAIALLQVLKLGFIQQQNLLLRPFLKVKSPPKLSFNIFVLASLLALNEICQIAYHKNLEEKDEQRQLLYYVSLIRACNKVLYQLVYIGKKFVFLKEPLYLINQ